MAESSSSIISITTFTSVIILAVFCRELFRPSQYKPVGLCSCIIPSSSSSSSDSFDDIINVEVLLPKKQQHPLVTIESSSSSTTAKRSFLGTTTIITASLCRSYSESYYEARDKFLRAAKTIPKVELHSFEVIPGESYTIDIAVVAPGGGANDGLVVHTSGVHGVEGYAGSAIQIAMLSHLGKLFNDVSQETTKTKINNTEGTTIIIPTIVFIHVVNPYGMAHNRRFNENNVDLNRNALHPNQWRNVLSRDVNYAGYDQFDLTLFNPPMKPTVFQANIKFWIQAVMSIIMNGFVTMKRAMVSAQYHNPRGIFYGGEELQQSHRIVQDFLMKRGYNSREFNGTVTWIDVHTGLGPCGVDTLLISGLDRDGKSDEPRWFPFSNEIKNDKNTQEGTKRQQRRVQDISSGTGGKVAAGYDLTVGTVNKFYESFFINEEGKKGTKKTMAGISSPSPPLVVTQEFGTVHPIKVARAMILENMAFHFAANEQPKWSEYTRDAFYVRTDEWRRNVLRRGLIVFSQAISRSFSSSSSSLSSSSKLKLEQQLK